MAWLDDFDCESITTVTITGLGDIVDFSANGQPIYGTGIIKYSGSAAVWMLSATEVLANDKINAPSTHSVVIDPAEIEGDLCDSDTCEIAINGKVEQFKMYTPKDIMGMGEVMQFTAIKKVVS